MSMVEAQILTRVIAPEDSPLDRKAADKQRMDELAEKARQGTLSPDERTEVESYERVGHILNIIQSKARQSLKSRHGTNGQTKAR